MHNPAEHEARRDLAAAHRLVGFAKKARFIRRNGFLTSGLLRFPIELQFDKSAHGIVVVGNQIWLAGRARPSVQLRSSFICSAMVRASGTV